MVRLSFLCLFAALIACNRPSKPERKVERALYFWKSVYKPTSFEQAQVKALGLTTLYVKFFDVVWKEETQKATPVAILQTTDSLVSSKLNIIPVVFITNEVLAKTPIEDIESLAIHCQQLISKMSTSFLLDSLQEIQMDCDWSGQTRDKYFTFLQHGKKLFSPARLSATIRLHQIKYRTKQGIPPVDRGLLMCYNMGNLKDPSTENSILSLTTLKKYTTHLSDYPLPLDVALPLFEWKVLFRNNWYVGLIRSLPDSLLHPSFARQESNRYHFLKDTLLSGYDFKKGDLLRSEKSDYQTVIDGARVVEEQLTGTDLRVSLFHLDSITLSKYRLHEMENMYNRFR